MDERIMTVPTGKNSVSFIKHDNVIANAAIDLIRAGAAIQRVVAAEAIEDVFFASAQQRIRR